MALRSGLLAAFAALMVVAVGFGPAAAKGPESVAALASELSPAVVNISSSRKAPGGVPFPDAPPGSPLNDYLDELNPNFGLGPEAMQEAQSLGSGFIISADGRIVTNNHVIEGAEEILVYLTDGTRLPAKVIGADDKTDLAVLKVEAPYDLTYVEFGDSDDADVGDWVMAIGNPFGLGGSVTLGIVSARNRDIQSGPYDSFIQTDASINQGNSGGPLFDMEGKVVGINTAIIARGGSSLGIGFAVPGNLAKPIIAQLAEYGETRRGWLGVGIQEVTDDIAASLGLAKAQGALVIDVTKLGPSDGFIREGDLILEFDNKPIPRMKDLPRIVAEAQVGTSVPVKVLRGGKEEVFSIVLGRLEAGEEIIANASREQQLGSVDPGIVDEPTGPAPGLDQLLGLEIAPLDETARKDFAIGGSIDGVVVTKVKPGTDAYEKGFLTGLVILEVNQHPIKTVLDVTSIVSTAKEDGRPAVLFKVAEPTGGNRFIAVKLE